MQEQISAIIASGEIHGVDNYGAFEIKFFFWIYYTIVL